MVPISNSNSASSKTSTVNGRNRAFGLAPMSPPVGSNEPLTYAHIGATGFYSDRGADESAMAPGRTDPAGQSTRQNRFQEVFERQAALLAAQQTGAPQNNSDFSTTAGWGALTQSASTPPVGAKKEMKWAITMVGNQVQLSINPNAS